MLQFIIVAKTVAVSEALCLQPRTPFPLGLSAKCRSIRKTLANSGTLPFPIPLQHELLFNNCARKILSLYRIMGTSNRSYTSVVASIDGNCPPGSLAGIHKSL